jgi:hypothetical protein
LFSVGVVVPPCPPLDGILPLEFLLGYVPTHPDFIYSRPPPFKVQGDFVPLMNPLKTGRGITLTGGYIRGTTLARQGGYWVGKKDARFKLSYLRTGVIQY